MGMLTEIHASTGAVYWIVSSYPGQRNDVEWMAVEQQHADASTPEELYRRIPTCIPYLGDGFLRPAAATDQCPLAIHFNQGLADIYKVVDMALYRSMAVWSHLEMIAFAETI